MSQKRQSKKKIIWVNIIFFTVTSLIGLIGAPIYIFYQGISFSEFFLFLFFLITSALGITVGYHRLFSHATYKAHPILQFILLFFGAAAFEQTALDWSSQHRDHHRFVDTDQDPYSIKKGFFYAHIGWLIFWKHEMNYDNVHDLQKNRLVMHQHRNYLLWCGFAGIVFPVLLGALTGHALGAFILSVCLRITLVYHATFCINSVCHTFGKATYDIYATARDHWLVALITFGEGYHNFHHRFPSDYRNGIRWFDWDPSKWLIAFFSYVGLAESLKRVSKFKILEARIDAERKQTVDFLENINDQSRFQDSLACLKKQHERLKQGLRQWEIASKEWSQIHCKFSGQSQNIQKKMLLNLRFAKESFQVERNHWKQLIHGNYGLIATVA